MNIYDFSVPMVGGGELSLAENKGKLMLIVNTATGCGFTPHYDPLEAMYKEMKDKGMSFEDHTVNHPDLSATAEDQQKIELKDSKSYLDKELSQTTTTVAYPSGRYSDATLQIAESLGYKMGLTTNNGLASLSNGLLTLNRVRVNPTTTAEDLLNEIATN